MNKELIIYILISAGLIFLLILILLIIILVKVSKKPDGFLFARELNNLEKNILKDSHENFNKVNNVIENKIEVIRNVNERKLDSIEKNINEKLDKSLNERLDSSFKSIGEQLQNLQNTNGKLIGMSGTITDLQKSLSSVKERGIFGEKQLESILENTMVKGMYETQYKIKNDERRMVDFVIKIPNKDDDGVVYLPIDSKFPNDKYVKIVDASISRNEELLNEAIKELEIAVKNEAKDISEKYILPPYTTDFAIMFLPTEGLYAECLRINGLAEFLQTKYHVILAGPTTVTAIINSFSIGFKFLQINKNSKEIAKILSAIKAQYVRFGEEIEITKKHIKIASESTEKLEKRNNMITSKLKSVSEIGIDESNKMLELEEEV